MKRIGSRVGCAALFALLVLMAAPAVRADQNGVPFLSSRFGLSGGVYVARARTDYQQGGAHLVGTLVSLEHDLGLEEDTDAARFDLFYRFQPRHAVGLGVIPINRAGHRVVDRTISFRDLVFSANSDVNTKFDSRLFKLDYRYSFLNDGRVETGISAGVSTYWYYVSMEGQASLADTSGGGGTTQLRNSTSNIVAPIPTVGIFTVCALRKDLIFRGSAEFFSINVGDFSGKLTDGKVALDYFPLHWLGIGVGFAGTSMGLNYNSGNEKANVDYRYSGILFTIDVVD